MSVNERKGKRRGNERIKESCAAALIRTSGFSDSHVLELPEVTRAQIHLIWQSYV